MPVRPSHSEAAPYDVSSAKPSSFHYETPGLRPQRGNLAANYDASVAIRQKTLRRQFGKKYDGKKIRNIYESEKQFALSFAAMALATGIIASFCSV